MVPDPKCGLSEDALDRIHRAAALTSEALLQRTNPVLRSVARKASLLTRSSVAAVLIEDHQRRWFPIVVGVDLNQVARVADFCRAALDSADGAIEILDARAALGPNRLRGDAPDLGFRFCASAPIRGADSRIRGLLCVLDRQPRPEPDVSLPVNLRALTDECASELDRLQKASEQTEQAIAEILKLIDDAALRGNDREVVELDGILQEFERQL